MREGRRLRLSYANVMSTLAVMIALGGTSYAAFSLPNNSVTSKKIKNGAVHATDLANGAVTGKKLAANAVGTSNLASNAVTSSKIAPAAVGTTQLGNAAVTASKLATAAVTSTALAPAAVTSTALAPNSVSESNIVPGSLNGQAFKCAAGDEGLDNRDECFFAITSGAGLTWTQAVVLCRGHSNTPATLASPAELAAAAEVGGSPFATGTFWTSQIATGATTFSNSTAYDAEVSGGTIVGLFPTQVTSTTIPSAACVYHAADES
jgi:hypothetical protein